MIFLYINYDCLCQNISNIKDTSIVSYIPTYRDSVTGHTDRLILNKDSERFSEWLIYFDTNRTQLAYRSYFNDKTFVIEEYWKNGNLRYKTEYIDTTTMRYSSTLHYETLYCENGQFVQKMIYGTSEKQHIKSFYCNGNKWVDQYFTYTAKYGVVGNFRYWYENGNIMFDTNYDDFGNKQGEWNYWKEDGSLDRIEVYKDDVLIETK
jgi:antitoxin component YwqK of YwqJK toxin-antitoxin module